MIPQLPEGDAKDNWTSDPYTQTVKRRLGDQLQAELVGLLLACSGSSDPKVAVQAERFKAVMETMVMLGAPETAIMRAIHGGDNG
jgi:hypothetical protein